MTGTTQDAGFSAPTAEVDPFQPTVGLLGILRVLFKWSFIVAPLGALTIWLALSQSEDIKPEFTAEISMILIGPNEVLIEDFETGEVFVEGVNPLQALGGTLTTVAQVTVLSMNDPSVPQRLADEGLTGKYEIGTLDQRSPILIARAFDVDPELAGRTIDRIEELIVQDLSDRQERLGAPPGNRISTQTISKGVADDADFGARDRIRLAIVGVGFAASAASAFFLEGLAELWRRRRRRKASIEAASDARGLPAGDRTGDRVAASLVETFDDLYSGENERLIATLHFLTGDEDLAFEIANETFDRASSVWPVPSRSHPIVWLYGEAVGRTLVRPSDERRLTAGSADTELWTALLELPTETRAVLALAYIGDLRNDRIATALSLDLQMVEQHRTRATRRLSRVRPAESGATEADEVRNAAPRIAEPTANDAADKSTSAGPAASQETVTMDGTARPVATDKIAPDVKATDKIAPDVKATDKIAPDVKATDKIAPDSTNAGSSADKPTVGLGLTPDTKDAMSRTVVETAEAAPDVSDSNGASTTGLSPDTPKSAKSKKTKKTKKSKNAGDENSATGTTEPGPDYDTESVTVDGETTPDTDADTSLPTADVPEQPKARS